MAVQGGAWLLRRAHGRDDTGKAGNGGRLGRREPHCRPFLRGRCGAEPLACLNPIICRATCEDLSHIPCRPYHVTERKGEDVGDEVTCPGIVFFQSSGI